MEHSRIKKRNVALIEKCVMSSIGIEGDAANLLI